ncbi:hypothetical protein TNCV_2639081 [Trichonephila clavipes]|nr:hypothetical protein TNCV_2639081 [Trichonephila clavipes]
MAVFRAVIEIVAGVTLSYTPTIITLNSDAEAGSYFGECFCYCSHLGFVVLFDEKHDGWWELILWSILTGRIVRAIGVFVGDGA